MASQKMQYLNCDTQMTYDNVHSTQPPHYQRYRQSLL